MTQSQGCDVLLQGRVRLEKTLSSFLQVEKGRSDESVGGEHARHGSTGCQRVSNTRDHLLVAVAGTNLAVGDHHNPVVGSQASGSDPSAVRTNIPWPRGNDRASSRQRRDDEKQA